ncbi:MAG: ABC transporter, permease protein (cluster 3, basic aa/glutamine/opines), partial [uncultured Rubrobacteraceae bacterium]
GVGPHLRRARGSLRGFPIRHGVHVRVAAVPPRRRAAHHPDLYPRHPARRPARVARGPWAALEQPCLLRVERLLRLLYPRDAPYRADLLRLPRPTATRPVRARPTAECLYPGNGDVRGAGLGDQLRRVHGGDIPRRHPVGGSRAGRGGAGSRDDAGADDAPHSPPPGRKGHHPADRQRVHRDDQRLRARWPRRHPGALLPRLEDRAPIFPEPGDAGGGGHHLLDTHQHLLLLPGAAGAQALEGLREGWRPAWAL